MSYKITALATLCVVVSSPVVAQGFSGGTLGFEYQQSISDSTDNGTIYYGEVEYSINRNFGIELDFAGDNNSSTDGKTTLHGIYHLNGNASVGAYYSHLSAGSATGSAYGIEGGTTFGSTDFSAYIGQIDAGSSDGLMLGFNSETPFGSQFEIFTDFNFIQSGGVWASNDKIGVQYNMNNGPELYANYGRVTVGSGGSGSSGDYIGVGARINFGAARGTTFEAR